MPPLGNGARAAEWRPWRWPLAIVVILLVATPAVAQLHAWGLPLAAASALGIAQTAPATTVRWWPGWSWLVAAGGLTVSTFLGVGQGVIRWPWPAASCLAMLVVVAVASAARRRAETVAAATMTVAAVILPALVTVPLAPGLVVLAVGAVAVAAGFGDTVRTRREAQTALRVEAAQRAVLQERARIAREMHDIVANRLSLVALQAEAAPHRLPGLPPAAHATFDALRKLAGEGLTEMRQLLGVLRDEDTPAPREPVPGLADLPMLIDRARHSGVIVHDRLDGTLTQVSLSPAAELAAYRAVQEALSNSARHAAGAAITIEMEIIDRTLQIAVRNDPPPGLPASRPHPEPAGNVTGYGLQGMRERVMAAGGTVTAGPAALGRFALVVRLPTSHGGDR